MLLTLPDGDFSMSNYSFYIPEMYWILNTMYYTGETAEQERDLGKPMTWTQFLGHQERRKLSSSSCSLPLTCMWTCVSAHPNKQMQNK